MVGQAHGAMGVADDHEVDLCAPGPALEYLGQGGVVPDVDVIVARASVRDDDLEAIPRVMKLLGQGV